ncbi:unnamed protein product [Euphydryas editha]|uniref:Uncharacterized protein n=1 Tax=Euphydryas editha TaxID=104508 RepID=A0AAU9VCV0_EUPED|nr:unnamed protein product [Euphydryas editha]
MSRENKNNWLCQACKNKIPKQDNTDTPVRGEPSHKPHSPPVFSYVTSRNKIRVHGNREQLSDQINQDLKSTSNMTLEADTVNCPSCGLSKTDIRCIVRDELKIIFDDFQGTFLKSLELKNKELIELIEQITLSLNFMEKKYEEVRRDVANKFESLRKLEAENKELIILNMVSELSSRLLQVEQHSRASNVEIHCVPEHTNS